MTKLKLQIALILLSFVLRVLTENRSSEAQAKIDNLLKPPTDYSLLQQQFPPIYTTSTEEPSFMSKVASWIYGGTSEKAVDTTVSETRYAPQYLPSPPNGYSQQPCNPCNREPWIPVAGKHGRDTVVGFVQQSHVQNHGYIPASNGYQQQQNGLQNFQPPPVIQQPLQYGPPVRQQQHVFPPLQNQYGSPKDNYGAPTNNNPVYKRPPENFRTPVQYFLPPPFVKQPLPLYKNQKLNPIKQSFPTKPGVLKTGPSKFRSNSPPQHGPPIPLNFGKPQTDKFKFSHSPSVTKAPLLKNNFIHASTRGNEGVLLQPPPFNIDYIASSLPSLNGAILPNYQLPSILPQNYVEQTRLSGSSAYNYPGTNNGFNKLLPLPTLNLHQNVPLYNAQPFQTGVSSAGFNNLQQQESKLKIQTNNGQSVHHHVQVIPSIRVADYLASIDHPINVIQSPLVEVIATETNENNNPEPVNKYTPVQLSENPIVVETHHEDTHVAATAQNLSIYNPLQNEKSNNNGIDQTIHLNNDPIEDNGKETSSFQIVHSGFDNEHLGTILPSDDLSVLTRNFTNHFDVFSQSENKSDIIIYKGIENQFLFTQPPIDYNNWNPTYGTLSTSMVPPPFGEPVWNTNSANRHETPTTKKPKQVQIIIPYISNHPYSKPDSYQKGTDNVRGSKEHQTNIAASPLPLYTQPPSIEEPVWSHYITKQSPSEETVLTEKPKPISNIRDILLKEEQKNKNPNKLPFDIIRLQKNIDDWTEQEFSNGLPDIHKASTSAKLVPSKKIPSEYLTTQPYDKIPNEITTVNSIEDILYDHEPAGSQTKISKVENIKDIDTNFILTEATTISTVTTIDTTATMLNSPVTDASASTAKVTKVDTLNVSSGLEGTIRVATANPMWEKLPVSVSTLTKEKVYVVTPQPWKFTPKEINEKLLPVTEPGSSVLTSPKFTVVIQPEGKSRIKESPIDGNGGLQIVYSEWPHLINNLQTTTTTEKPKTTNHALFGLMDLSSYTPPPNSTVETYGGHSRVITVVTPTSVTKKVTPFADKKTTKSISVDVTKRIS